MAGARAAEAQTAYGRGMIEREIKREIVISEAKGRVGERNGQIVAFSIAGQT
jgi:hypothetical protein